MWVELGQGQVDVFGDQIYFMQGLFYWNGVGFDEQCFVQWYQVIVDGVCGCGVVVYGGGVQVVYGVWCDVGGYGDVVFVIQQYQFDGSGVVVGIDEEVFVDVFDDFFGVLQVVGGFFDVDDVWYFGQVFDGFWKYVVGGVVWYVVEDLWDCNGFGDMVEVLVYVFLGWFVVVWCYQQVGVGVVVFCGFGQCYCFVGGVGVGVGDYWDVVFDLVDYVMDYLDVFFYVQCG